MCLTRDKGWGRWGQRRTEPAPPQRSCKIEAAWRTLRGKERQQSGRAGISWQLIVPVHTVAPDTQHYVTEAPRGGAAPRAWLSRTTRRGKACAPARGKGSARRARAGGDSGKQEPQTKRLQQKAQPIQGRRGPCQSVNQAVSRRRQKQIRRALGTEPSIARTGATKVAWHAVEKAGMATLKAPSKHQPLGPRRTTRSAQELHENGSLQGSQNNGVKTKEGQGKAKQKGSARTNPTKRARATPPRTTGPGGG